MITRISKLPHRVVVLLLALVLGVAVVAVIGVAQAATPAAGKVSDTSRAVSWGAGPFVVPNQTGNAGDPVCTVPMSCDDFALTVNTPAGYESTHNLVVTVTWPTATADFDVYLLTKAGVTVKSSASSADPEVIIQGVPAGDYIVRVVPFIPAGDSFTAKAVLTDVGATGGGGVGPGTPSTETAPTLSNYPAPSTFSDVDNAGEPSIGNSFKSGATMYQASLSTYKAVFNDATSPAGVVWSNVSASATNGCPLGKTTSLDPILFTDHATGRTFQSQLTGVNSATCYTDNDGGAWSPSTGGGIPSGVDHQTIGGGAYKAGAVGPLPTSTYPDALFYCSQSVATAFCAASNDGGTTFGAGVPTYNLQDCVGLHGHIRVAPDGTAYLPNKACGGKAAAVVSEDGGLTWNIRPVPGSSEGESDPSVGVGRNGTAYLGYVGADGKPAVATSNDKGLTWHDNQTVGTEFAIKNAVFPTVIAGDDDRAAVAYLGTPTAGAAGATGVFTGVWHLYVDYTYDGGKTWVTTDVTPNDPVQRGSVCTAGTTCGADRNLLDFMDITTDDHGRVLVGWADGCIAACVGDDSAAHANNLNLTADYHAAYATISRQSTGKPLFAKYDPVVTSGTPTPTMSPTVTSTVTATATGTAAPSPGVNTAPVARAAADPALVLAKKPVTLSAVGTTDAQTPASQLTYAWNFSGVAGAVDATGPVVTTTYPKRGSRMATVTVTDPQGLKDTESVLITVQRRRAFETSRFKKHGSWRLVHKLGDHHKHVDNLGTRPSSGQDRVDLTFDGTSTTIAWGKTRGGGSAQVLIDGVSHGTISFKGRTPRVRFRAHHTYSGLTAGSHRLTLLVTGRAYLDYAQY